MAKNPAAVALGRWCIIEVAGCWQLQHNGYLIATFNTKDAANACMKLMSAGKTSPLSPAQALGRLGGLKGGKARAAKLSPERASEIGKKAAKARWAKPR